MEGWCRRDPLTRPFCSRLDASRGDAFEASERHHAHTIAAGSRLSVGEAHRAVAVNRTSRRVRDSMSMSKAQHRKKRIRRQASRKAARRAERALRRLRASFTL
jgi:hypothetical protein